MNQLKSTMGAIREGWLGLSTPKKAGLITALLSIFLLVSGLSYYSQRVEYTTLFSGLEEADAGIIVNDLEAKAISYKLEDNGRTILIDDTQLDKYRIQLAVDGMMPETSTGFEIFDETSMMATDEDRNIMYQRAVTGELERAITSLQSVESAKVILSIPEGSVFWDRTTGSQCIRCDRDEGKSTVVFCHDSRGSFLGVWCGSKIYRPTTSKSSTKTGMSWEMQQ